MGTGSVDQTGNYVFAVVPSAVAPSGSKHSVYWQYQGGFDTMYTLWNPDAKLEDLLVTVYFGKGVQQYKVPLHLEAGASKMIDIAALVMAGTPDAEGHSLPMGPMEGHLVISGLKPAVVLVSGKFFPAPPIVPDATTPSRWAARRLLTIGRGAAGDAYVLRQSGDRSSRARRRRISCRLDLVFKCAVAICPNVAYDESSSYLVKCPSGINGPITVNNSTTLSK